MAAERLKLVKRLGQGAFAQTFKAEVIDSHLAKKWSKVVAVKIPLGDDTQDVVVDDIVNMAHIQGVLSCRPAADAENLVRFYGWERCKGSYAMVCEFVDGMDLEKWMDTRKSARVFSFLDTIEIAIRVCAALTVMHDSRIYHRDIKPSNVLVVRTGDKLTVKLADFVLSTILDRGSEEVSTSRTGALAYTPPENMIDPAHPISPSYDLYSLGLLLYQMICNALPYKRLDGIGVPKEAIDQDTPFRHPHDLVLGVPEKLAGVIVKAVEKRPERRYQSAEEMASDLREAKEDVERVICTMTVSVPEVKVRIRKITERLEKETQGFAKAYPDQPEVFVLQGRFFEKWLGNPARAAKSYLEGLDRFPEDSVLLYWAGRALSTQPNASAEQRAQGAEYLARAVQNGLAHPKQVMAAERLVKAHKAGLRRPTQVEVAGRLARAHRTPAYEN
jgi:serine/threonine-protein kinase